MRMDIDNIKILLKDYSTVLFKDFDRCNMNPIGVHVYDDIYISIQDTFPNFCREVTWYEAMGFVGNIGKGVYLPSWEDMTKYRNNGRVIDAVLLLIDGYILDDGKRYWTSDVDKTNKEHEKAGYLYYSSSSHSINVMDKSESARVRTFINIKPEEEQEEPNVPRPNKENSDVLWHTLGGDEPTIDSADCLVLVAVDENKEDRYEILEWNDKVKAFKWKNDDGREYYFPAHNFTKWAYVKDLARLKTTEPMPPDMIEEISNRRYELYQKPMEKTPECAKKEAKIPYCTSNPLLNGVK